MLCTCGFLHQEFIIRTSSGMWHRDGKQSTMLGKFCLCIAYGMFIQFGSGKIVKDFVQMRNALTI
jgi:hypothetical protein